MWFRKNKIKETKKRKPGMYGNRHSISNYSMWDNMSFIEKFIMLLAPPGITYIDYMSMSLMFELPSWILIIIAISSTLLLMTIVWLVSTWLSGE